MVFDTNGDGFVSLEELKTSINIILDYPKDEIDEIFREAGMLDGDNRSLGLVHGLLDYHTFLKIVFHRALDDKSTKDFPKFSIEEGNFKFLD